MASHAGVRKRVLRTGVSGFDHFRRLALLSVAYGLGRNSSVTLQQPLHSSTKSRCSKTTHNRTCGTQRMRSPVGVRPEGHARVEQDDVEVVPQVADLGAANKHVARASGKAGLRSLGSAVRVTAGASSGVAPRPCWQAGYILAAQQPNRPPVPCGDHRGTLASLLRLLCLLHVQSL